MCEQSLPSISIMRSSYSKIFNLHISSVPVSTVLTDGHMINNKNKYLGWEGKGREAIEGK